MGHDLVHCDGRLVYLRVATSHVPMPLLNCTSAENGYAHCEGHSICMDPSAKLGAKVCYIFAVQ